VYRLLCERFPSLFRDEGSHPGVPHPPVDWDSGKATIVVSELLTRRDEEGVTLQERLRLLSRLHPYTQRTRSIIKRVCEDKEIARWTSSQKASELEFSELAFQDWMTKIRKTFIGNMGKAMCPRKVKTLSIFDALKQGKEHLRRYFPDVPTSKLSWYVEDSRRTASAILGV
jgi:hypothetical protein